MAKQIALETWNLDAQAKALAFGSGTGLKQINSWFGPAEPLQPIAPADAGWLRAYDYNQATNVQVLPKRVNEGVSYTDLHQLAENSDYVSVCIQTVQDRLSQHTGRVVDTGKDPTNRSDAAKAIDQWLQRPDGVTSLHQFLSLLVYDQCVTDAATVGIDRSSAFPVARVIDGSTICPRINEQGVVVGYQQIIKGMPAHDYDINTIIWKPKNRRPHKLYGYSPVEQIYRIITLALKRTARQLDWFTEGAIPAMLIAAPEGWTPEQISAATENWDKLVKGVSGKEAVKFTPAGCKPEVFDRNPAQDEFDEWLIRVICYAFSLPPTAFIKSNNRATAETTQAASLAEGHAALLQWSADLLTEVINVCWGPGYEWQWDLSVQPDLASTTALIQAGALKPSVLQKYGYDADDIEDALPPKPVPGAFGAPGAAAAGASAAPGPKDATKAEADVAKPGLDANQAQKSESKVTNSDAGEDICNAADPDIDPDFMALLEDYLADLQQNAITAGLKAYKNNATVSLADDPGFAIKVKKHLENAFAQGVNNGHVLYAADVDKGTLSDIAKDWAKENAAKMVGMKYNDAGELVDNPDSTWSIAQTSRDAVQAKVSKAFEDHLTPSQLSQSISEDSSFEPRRALMIARTETAAAQSVGAVSYYKEAGVDQKEWSDQDGCDICQANAAQGPIAIDDAFESGDMYAPAHPNCRCVVLPVAKSTGIINDEE